MEPRRNLFAVAALLIALVVGIAFVVARSSVEPRAFELAADAGGAAAARQPAPVGKARPGVSTLLSRTPAPVGGSAVAVNDETAVGGAFEGRVVSWSTGAGVENAEVSFDWKGGITSVRADSEGRFVFAPREPGAFALVAVAAVGYLPFAPEWGHSPIGFTAAAGVRIRDVVIYLTPAIDYLGVVLSPEDKPVPNCMVRLLDVPLEESALMPLQDKFVTDDKGEFRFHAPDRALLEARHPGYAPARARVDFAVQVSHRLVLRLRKGESPKSASISGRVEDARGQGVEGALVVASFHEDNPAAAGRELRPDRQAVSGPEGAFEVGDLDSGVYGLAAAKPGLAPARVSEVAAGSRNVLLRLLPGGRMTGRVTEAATGAPIPAFSILVETPRGPIARDLDSTASFFAADGRYAMDDLSPGKHEVTAYARGFAPSQPASVDVPEPGSASAIADFSLRKGGRMVGTVVSAKTKVPLKGARVTVEGWGTQPSPAPIATTSVTGVDGAFELTGLRSGPFSITAAAKDHHGRAVSGLQVEDGRTLGPTTLELNPVEPGGQPRLELTGIGAVLQPKGEGLVIGEAIAEGGAAKAGLVAGDIILAVDGVPAAELGFNGAINRLRGPEGSVVKVTVRRASGGPSVEIAITRALVRR